MSIDGKERVCGLLSILTPSFNESGNIELFYQELRHALQDFQGDWEWILVDDHSTDNSFQIFQGLAESDSRLKGLRFSQNYGSHSAVTCGLHEARGDCTVALAVDLQDPPELIPSLIEAWERGSELVWAVRKERPGESKSTVGFARVYYFLLRNILGFKHVPPTGADFFLLDSQVVRAFRRHSEGNVNVFVLLSSLGFEQAQIEYDKRPRYSGISGWTVSKKIKLVVDSVTAFSFLPMRVMSAVGILFSLLGAAYAVYLVLSYLINGSLVWGWGSLMMMIVVTSGIQMTMLGIMGEYLWRTLDQVRGRPRYLVEKRIGSISTTVITEE